MTDETPEPQPEAPQQEAPTEPQPEPETINPYCNGMSGYPNYGMRGTPGV